MTFKFSYIAYKQPLNKFLLGSFSQKPCNSFAFLSVPHINAQHII